METQLKQTIEDLVKIINEKEIMITNLRLNNESLLRENNNLKGEEVNGNTESEK